MLPVVLTFSLHEILPILLLFPSDLRALFFGAFFVLFFEYIWLCKLDNMPFTVSLSETKYMF